MRGGLFVNDKKIMNNPPFLEKRNEITYNKS